MSADIIRRKRSFEEMDALEQTGPSKSYIKGFAAVAVKCTENLEIQPGDLHEMFKIMSEAEGDVKISSLPHH